MNLQIFCCLGNTLIMWKKRRRKSL